MYVECIKYGEINIYFCHAQKPTEYHINIMGNLGDMGNIVIRKMPSLL